MLISDKEYKQNLKQYTDSICNKNGKELIIPTEYTKQLYNNVEYNQITTSKSNWLI